MSAVVGDAEPQVIIVGGGPVGLAAALELARFGVRSILLEKHESTSWHPKTRNLNTRTMEIARGWGAPVYDRLRAIDTPPGWKSPIRFLRTAVGEELGAIESKGFEGPGPDISPAEPIMSSQEMIEEILLDAVRESGLVELRFSTEVTGVVAGDREGDDHAAVTVRSRDTGATEVLSAPALVAADGAASTIRRELGVELHGQRELLHLVNCYFQADIEAHLGDRRGVLFFVSNDRATGVLQPLDAAGRWLCQISVGADDHDPDVFTRHRAEDWIRAAVGVDALDVEVRSIGFWKLNATVAERLVHGRVVLCGDAAHQFPPTGGLGVNTGLQGMHNVMWKLALAVRGTAAWPLVATYDDERRDIAEAITAQSLQNSINVARLNAAAAAGTESGLTPEEILAESRRYGNHLGIELGASYVSSAVVPDGTSPPEVGDSYTDYAPSATPGCRAPHVWLGSPQGGVSTLDLIGAGFVLLAAGGSEDGDRRWREVVATVAGELGVAIDCYVVGSPGLGSDAFAARYGLGPGGAVLIRPDGHVAWRAADGPADAEQLSTVLAQILSR